MNARALFTIVALVTPLIIAVMPAQAGEPTSAGKSGSKGFLELESNLSDVDLRCCPQDKYQMSTVRVFFGLLKTKKSTCIVSEVFLGTTPLKPVSLPAGKYVLLLPPGHVWEHKGPIEFKIMPARKTFFSLKLFKRNIRMVEGDHAEGGAGAPGQAGSGPPE